MSKLTTSDKVIAGAAIVFLLAMFLPWYGIDNDFGQSLSNSGWDYFLGGIIPLLLLLVMTAQILITKLSPDTKLPDPPVPWSQVHLIAGAAAAIIVVLRLLIASDNVGSIDVGIDLDRKIGLFVAVIAAVAAAAGGFLKFQEGDNAAPPSSGSPGAAPF